MVKTDTALLIKYLTVSSRTLIHKRLHIVLVVDCQKKKSKRHTILLIKYQSVPSEVAKTMILIGLHCAVVTELGRSPNVD